MVTKKLQGTHAVNAGAAGAQLARPIPLPRTIRPAPSSVENGCINQGANHACQPPPSAALKQAGRGRKDRDIGLQKFLRGFFTLLSDDRIDLMERT